MAENDGVRSIYLDANVLIYAVEAGNPWTEQLRTLLRRIYSRDLVAVSSELTLAEVLAKPYASGLTELIDDYETLFSPESALTALPIDKDILRRTARLRSRPRLKLADAIHVATALQAECTHFVSNDLHLLGALPSPLIACPMNALATL